MIKNFLKITWRNLNKNRMSSFINVGGLALGMAVTILIGLWIRDELNYDRYHAHYDKIGQVYFHSSFNGTIHSGRSMPIPLGAELRSKYGRYFRYITMASWEGSQILSYGDNHIAQNGIFIEKDAPAMLSLNMRRGNSESFTGRNSMLLSVSAARALFGDEDPMLKTVKVGGDMLLTVAGVYDDLPHNTSFCGLNFLIPWDLYIQSERWIANAQDDWDESSFQIFAQIADDRSFSEVNAAIKDAKQNNMPEAEKSFHHKVFLHPMKDWHLRSNWENGVLANGQEQYVWMFGAIGLFVLFLACINFMNLSTAKSEKRAREVGIRKTIGSERKTLVIQFLYESVMVALIAFVISLLMFLAALPWFNQVAGKEIELPWNSGVFWGVGLGASVLTGLVAGSYPALYLSSFNPVAVLKGTFKAGRLAAVPRRVLVVLQFTISITLIIGTLVVYRQIVYTKERPTGYDRDRLVFTEMRSPAFYGKLDILDHRLKQAGAIASMSESSSPINGVHSNNSGFQWEGKDPDLHADFATIWVTHDYGKSIGWKVTSGRDFSRDFKADTAGIIVNEAALRFMGIKDDPIGKPVTWGKVTYRIIGIVKDVVMSSPFQPVKQAIYLLDAENVNFINFRLDARKPVAESLAKIEEVFKEVIPDAPFDYKFADQEYAAKFRMEERVGELAFMFTFLAIVISCLGLFGLATFTAEQRIKEIGIRKIVGAPVFSLWRLLSSDFLLLTVTACIIATPLAYYGMQSWLQKYTYRVTITWDIFAVATGAALLLSMLTVSYQTLRAAVTNPVKSLRTE